MSKDHWRITTAAIQLEMERLAGLLQKSAQFHARTSTPHSIRERNDVRLNSERNDVRTRPSTPAGTVDSAEIASRL